MLLIIPAIDIKDGKCVRLVQGEPGTEKIYSDDPVQTAILWRGENFKALHVVDLDGAFEGKMKNFDIVREMVKAVDIPLQVGGGIRTYDQVQQLLGIGVYRVVVSTMAVEDPDLLKKLVDDFGPSKIVVGIDAKNGIVQTRGWKEDTMLMAVSLALNIRQLGAQRIVYTDILRDGTMVGPNFEAIKTVAVKTGLKVTASGGVSGIEDLYRLQELEQYGVDSVIVGKALYENRFACQELWRLNERELTDLAPTRRKL